jgi:potassium-transporting ATPase potassium-binding subunit
MNTSEIIQIILFFGLGIALTPPVGRFMAKIFKGERTFLHPLLYPVEKLVYRATGIDSTAEMSWLGYLAAMTVFTVVGFASLMAMLMTQQWLPFNPMALPNLSWHLAFNTAWSFTCNADWQSYMGEATMSYFSQTVGLSVHQFLSGAGGIAVLAAVARALKRASLKTIGNFWTDLTRSTLYLVIPLSVLWAIPLAWQGVPQTWKPYVTASVVEPYTTQVPKTDDKGNAVNGKDGKPVMVDLKVDSQVIPIGPVASFESCKQIFTNGGGWFGVNSAHPLENPTPLSSFLEMLAIIVIPMAQVYMFGLMVGNRRHAWTLFAVMLSLYVLSFAVAYYAESQPNPVLTDLHSNMEGKEVRFGVMNSVLWGTSATAIDNGSVNSMHDSWMPLAGLMPMWNILVGEMLFGGVGCGMYCMMFHVLITVFIAGLMIGRTPEYLGKKLGAWEATWAVIGVLGPNAACLIPAAMACVTPSALASLGNSGPHGFSEILYAFGEAANNNGSAFAGLNANIPWYDVALGLAIIIGRFAPIIAALAIAGRLASKRTAEASAGTLPTHGWTFGLTLTGVIVIVAALTFFPAVCLGPLVEHGLMLAGRTF